MRIVKDAMHDISVLLDSIEAANAEIARLRSALKAIADECPATCDMSLAHMMAYMAESALSGKK